MNSSVLILLQVTETLACVTGLRRMTGRCKCRGEGGPTGSHGSDRSRLTGAPIRSPDRTAAARDRRNFWWVPKIQGWIVRTEPIALSINSMVFSGCRGAVVLRLSRNIRVYVRVQSERAFVFCNRSVEASLGPEDAALNKNEQPRSSHRGRARATPVRQPASGRPGDRHSGITKTSKSNLVDNVVAQGRCWDRRRAPARREGIGFRFLTKISGFLRPRRTAWPNPWRRDCWKTSSFCLGLDQLEAQGVGEPRDDLVLHCSRSARAVWK